MPGLGIAGAGVAFGLYYCGAMLFLLRYMASGRAGLTLRPVTLRYALFADILKVGLPTSLNALFYRRSHLATGGPGRGEFANQCYGGLWGESLWFVTLTDPFTRRAFL